MVSATATHRCEMGSCEKDATHYGGYSGAFDWAGYVCEEHSGRMSWREPAVAIEQGKSVSSFMGGMFAFTGCHCQGSCDENCNADGSTVIKKFAS